ncbi:unnamed protein product, partial [Allacma fusca]
GIFQLQQNFFYKEVSDSQRILYKSRAVFIFDSKRAGVEDRILRNSGEFQGALNRDSLLHLTVSIYEERGGRQMGKGALVAEGVQQSGGKSIFFF